MTEYQSVTATLGVTVKETSGQATLTVQGPIDVVEDTPTTYTGRLTGVGAVALPGQVLQILVDSVPKTTATTGADGSYSAQVVFDKPARVTLQVTWAGGTGLPP